MASMLVNTKVAVPLGSSEADDVPLHVRTAIATA